MSKLERVADAAVSGHLMWRANERARQAWEVERERELGETGQDSLYNISADSAAASGAASTFWEKLEEGAQVRVNQTEWEDTHWRMTERWKGLGNGQEDG